MKNKKYLRWFLFLFILVVLAFSRFYFDGSVSLTDPTWVLRIQPLSMGSESVSLMSDQELEHYIATYQNKYRQQNKSLTDSLDTYQLEQYLRSLALVETAAVFYNLNHQICIDITTKIPLVQILFSDGSSYYLDKKGYAFKIPTTIAVKVQLARGNFPMYHQLQQDLPSKDLHRLLELVSWIEDHNFWKTQIDHIYFSAKKEFFFQTKVGMHIVVLGTWEDPKTIDHRMQKLYRLYTKGWDKSEWNQFDSIQLQLDHQVVVNRR